MFGRAAITLGIGPHSSLGFVPTSHVTHLSTTPCVAVVMYILMSSVHIRLLNGGCDYIPVSCAALCFMKCEFNLSTNLNLKMHFY